MNLANRLMLNMPVLDEADSSLVYFYDFSKYENSNVPPHKEQIKQSNLFTCNNSGQEKILQKMGDFVLFDGATAGIPQDDDIKKGIKDVFTIGGKFQFADSFLNANANTFLSIFNMLTSKRMALNSYNGNVTFANANIKLSDCNPSDKFNIAIVIKNGGFKAYISKNGGETQITDYKNTAIFVSDDLKIECGAVRISTHPYGFGNGYLRHKIKNFFVYNRELSEEEIGKLIKD